MCNIGNGLFLSRFLGRKLRFTMDWDIVDIFNFHSEDQEFGIGIPSIMLKESSYITLLPQDEENLPHTNPSKQAELNHSSSSWKPSNCLSSELDDFDQHSRELAPTLSCLEVMDEPSDMLQESFDLDVFYKAGVPISPPDMCSRDVSLCKEQLHGDNNNLHPLLDQHDTEKPFRCTVCPKAFRLSSTLSAHKKLHDQRGPSLRCETCGRVFTQPSALSSHRLLHRTDRPHSCSLCGKEFVRLHALKTHVLVHANERPYECNLCEKAFTEKHVLVRHRKTHSDERPHECTECSKTFKERYDLLRHTLIHSGLRSHKCPDCSKTFVQSNALVKHRKCHERVHIIGRHQTTAETTCC